MSVGEWLAVVLPLLAFMAVTQGMLVSVLGKRIDDLGSHVDRFEKQMHDDMQAHTQAIADLRAWRDQQ